MSQSSMLSASGIEVMKLMASDRLKAHALVQDSVCIGGLVMVLSNADTAIVKAALETLMKLAEWPDLQSVLKESFGMQEQLEALLVSSVDECSDVVELARKVYNHLYKVVPSAVVVAPFKDTINQLHRPNHVQIKKDSSARHRRNSFFVSGATKAKTVMLQIRGLIDQDDMDVCRNSLLTVPGIISITFDFKKKRAILRTKPDLRPELLAHAVARTMTMSAEQLIKNDDGTETLLSFNTQAEKENLVEMPEYPSDLGSPVTGTQNLVRHGQAGKHGGSWGFIQSIGSFISNSLYW